MTAAKITASKAQVVTEMDTKAVSQGVKRIERDLNSLKSHGRSIANLGAQIRGLGEGVNRFGRRLTVAGVAAAAPFGLALKQAGDFERAMSQIKVNIGAKIKKDASIAGKSFENQAKQIKAIKQEYDQLGRTIRSIARRFPKGPLEVAQSATTLARAGLSKSLIQGQAGSGRGGILKGVVQLAVADTSGADLDEITKKTLSLLKAFDLLKKQAGETDLQVGNRIFRDFATLQKASTAANVSVASLAESMKFTGGIFAKQVKADKTGKAFREVIAVTSVLQERLGDASIAGTALRGMMLRLQNPPKKVADALRSVGFDAKTMTDSTGEAQLGLVALLRTIEQMQGRVRQGGASASEFQQFLASIFENRQITGALSLLDEGVDSITKKVRSIAIKGSPQGFMDDFTDELKNNITGAAVEAKNSLQDLAIEIGTSVSPEVQGAVNVFKDLVDAMTKTVKENPRLVKQVLFLTGAMAALGATVAVAGAAISTFSLGVISLGIGLIGIRKAIDGVNHLFGTLRATAKGMITPFGDAVKAVAKMEKAKRGIRAVRNELNNLAMLARNVDSIASIDLPKPQTNFWVDYYAAQTKAANEAAEAAKRAAKVQRYSAVLRSFNEMGRNQPVVSGYLPDRRAGQAAELDRRFKDSVRAAAAAEKAAKRQEKSERESAKNRRAAASVRRQRANYDRRRRPDARVPSIIRGPSVAFQNLQVAFGRLAAVTAILTAEFSSLVRDFTIPFSKINPITPAAKQSPEVKKILAARDASVAARAEQLRRAAGVAAATSVSTGINSSSLMTASQIAGMLEDDRRRAAGRGGGGLIVQNALTQFIRDLERVLGVRGNPSIGGSRRSDRMYGNLLENSAAQRSRAISSMVAGTAAAGFVLPSGRGAGGSGQLPEAMRLLENLYTRDAITSLRKVDMNLDDISLINKELRALIGPKKASKITDELMKSVIAVRALQDVLNIRGIGPRSLEKIVGSGKFVASDLSRVAPPVQSGNAGLLGFTPRKSGPGVLTGGSTVRNGSLKTIINSMLAGAVMQRMGITDQSGLFRNVTAIGERGFTSGQINARGPAARPRTGGSTVPLIAATPADRRAVFMGERRSPKPTGGFFQPGRPASPMLRLTDERMNRGYYSDFYPGQRRRGRKGAFATLAQRARIAAKRRGIRGPLDLISERVGAPDEFTGIQGRRLRGRRLGMMAGLGAKGVGKAGLIGLGGMVGSIGKLGVSFAKVALGVGLVISKITVLAGLFTGLILSGNLIGNVFDAVAKGMSGTFGAASEQLETISSILAAFKFRELEGEITTTGSKINTVMASIKDGLIIILANFAKEIPGTLLSVGKAVINSIQQLIVGLFETISNGLRKLIAGSSEGGGGIGAAFESVLDEAISGAQERQAKRKKLADARIAKGQKEADARLARITGVAEPKRGRERFEELRKTVLEEFKGGELPVEQALQRLDDGLKRIDLEELEFAAKDMRADLQTAGEKFKETMELINDMARSGVIDIDEQRRFAAAARADFRKNDPGHQAIERAAKEQRRAAESIKSAAMSVKESLFPQIKLDNDVEQLSKALIQGELTLHQYNVAVAAATKSANEAQANLDQEEKSRTGLVGGSIGSASSFFARNNAMFGTTIQADNEKLLNTNLKAQIDVASVLKDKILEFDYVGQLTLVQEKIADIFGPLTSPFKTLADAASSAATSLLGLEGWKVDKNGVLGLANKGANRLGGILGLGAGQLGSYLPRLGEYLPSGQTEKPQGTGFGFMSQLMGELGSPAAYHAAREMLANQGLAVRDNSPEADAALERRNKAVARAAVLEEMLNKQREKGLIGGQLGGGQLGGPRFMAVSGARANGGPVRAGGTYVVGEKGPELFFPTEKGHILSNGLSKKIDGMFAGGTNETLGGRWQKKMNYMLFNHMDQRKMMGDFHLQNAKNRLQKPVKPVKPRKISDEEREAGGPTSITGLGEFWRHLEYRDEEREFGGPTSPAGDFSLPHGEYWAGRGALPPGVRYADSPRFDTMSINRFMPIRENLTEPRRMADTGVFGSPTLAGITPPVSPRPAAPKLVGPRKAEKLSKAKAPRARVQQNTNASRMASRLGPVAAGDQNTAANRFDLRSRAMTGLPEGVQNTAANRMKHRLGKMSGLPDGVQNTAANRMKYRLRQGSGLPAGVQNTAANRLAARIDKPEQVVSNLGGPTLRNDASNAGANTRGGFRSSDLEALAKDATLEKLATKLERLIAAAESGMN